MKLAWDLDLKSNLFGPKSPWSLFKILSRVTLCRRLFLARITLVARGPDQPSGENTRIGFNDNPVGITRSQERNRDARLKQRGAPSKNISPTGTP